MSQPSDNSNAEAGGKPGVSFSATSKPISIKVEPEQAGSNPGSDEQRGPDPGENLEAIKRRRERQIADRELQDTHHDGDLHGIRKAHAKFLLCITVGWLLLIWFILMLNGFGQWFLLWGAPDAAQGERYLPFKLSDTVMVAFITSTTATVLGLYGIAAYWLYGKRPTAGDRHDKSAKQNPKLGDSDAEEN